jgi:Uma2 family endonuclease
VHAAHKLWKITQLAWLLARMQSNGYPWEEIRMAQPAPETIRPLRRVEYDQLVQLGAFGGERIELLEGALVQMSPIGSPHAFVVTRLTELLVLSLSGRAMVRVQLPFAAGELSEPEPDFAIVPLGDYYDEHPKTALWIIEVASSSLVHDRGIKQRIYAQAGVPEYWIIDVSARRIEVLRDPHGDGYRSSAQIAAGERVAPAAFPDLTLSVRALWP